MQRPFVPASVSLEGKTPPCEAMFLSHNLVARSLVPYLLGLDMSRTGDDL